MIIINGGVESEKKRGRDESDEFELASPEVKRLRDDLVGFLEDSDPSTATPDLDLFMQSFQQEISSAASPEKKLPDGSGGPDLGYLLEASDDELGLPPPTAGLGISSNIVIGGGGGETWGFDEEIVSYDEFGLLMGAAAEEEEITRYNEYVALEQGGGLFDYSDAGFSTLDVDPSELNIWKLHQPAAPSQLSPLPISIPLAAASTPEIP